MRDEIERVRASAARAALDPAVWPDTLYRLSRLIGADMTMFEHIDKADGTIELGFTDRPDMVAATREPYEQHFYAVNPRYPVWRAQPIGVMMHDGLIGDARALDRDEFYADFLRPFGLKYFVGAAATDDAERTMIFSLQRAPGRGPFGAAARRTFAAILPDVRNAMALYLRKVHAPPGETLGAALDRLGDPIAVLARDGRLVFANDAMRRLIAARDVVVVRDGVIAGAHAAAGRALGAAVRLALAGGRSGSAAAASPGGGPLVFRVVPLDHDRAGEFAPCAERLLCLLIDDPARPHWPHVEEAMALFGLTRREAIVGTHLAAGLRVGEIAQRLGVSRNTVRSQVAMLREKLGVRSALAVAAELRRAASPFI